jgi:uncharacterized metal-binding protein
MPDYKTHDRIGGVTAAISGLAVGALTQDQTAGLIVASSCMIGTWFFSPDLDISSKMRYRWSVLYFLWIPYEKIIPHRSWVSHSGPISATLRICYLLFIVLIPWYFVSYDTLYLFMGWVHNNAALLFWIYIGLILADTIHVIADKTIKGKKKYD